MKNKLENNLLIFNFFFKFIKQLFQHVTVEGSPCKDDFNDTKDGRH